MRYVDHGDGLFTVVGGAFPLCNTQVIDSGELSVIDPGCAIEDLRAFLRSRGRELRDVKNVMLSHIHPDHITHAVRLERLSRCRIVANEITAPLFNDKEKMKVFLGFHPGHPVREHWERLVNDRMYGALEEGRVGEVVSDGDRIALGDVTLRMLSTPGHTADHMCIEVVETKTMIAADIDCTEFGPYYGHPTSSIPSFRDSIRRLHAMDISKFLSGHATQVEIRDHRQALEAYDRQFDIREDLVLNAVVSGAKSLDDIVSDPIVYPSLSNVVFLQFERWMIEHHVKSLITKGLLREDRGVLKAT
ncbi:MAG: MBL fold metallo-hydrolase [Candidatus Thorarchaeota archaeon]|nr:MBL fold metallo-hydrolase [Candidatus Thorarchaeota archaeon]